MKLRIIRSKVNFNFPRRFGITINAAFKKVIGKDWRASDTIVIDWMNFTIKSDTFKQFYSDTNRLNIMRNIHTGVFIKDRISRMLLSNKIRRFKQDRIEKMLQFDLTVFGHPKEEYIKSIQDPSSLNEVWAYFYPRILQASVLIELLDRNTNELTYVLTKRLEIDDVRLKKILYECRKSGSLNPTMLQYYFKDSNIIKPTFYIINRKEGLP